MSLKNFLKSNKKRTGVIISVILIVSGIIPLIIFTFYADPTNQYTISPKTLISADNTQIDTLVYTPKETTGNLPGVVVGHGFCGNKQFMQYISIELVKRGFVVVDIDFRGHGSSSGSIEFFSLTSQIASQFYFDQS